MIGMVYCWDGLLMVYYHGYSVIPLLGMVYCWLSLTGHGHRGHWGRPIAPCGRRSDRLGPSIVHDAEGQHARREETRKTRKRSARGIAMVNWGIWGSVLWEILGCLVTNSMTCGFDKQWCCLKVGEDPKFQV